MTLVIPRSESKVRGRSATWSERCMVTHRRVLADQTFITEVKCSVDRIG